MDIDIINETGFDLLTKVIERVIPSRPSTDSEEDLIGEVCIAELHLSQPAIRMGGDTDSLGRWANLRCRLGNKEIIVNNLDYKIVTMLADEIYKSDPLYQYSNLREVEELIRLWIYESHSNEKHSKLESYTRFAIEENTTTYTYHFKIIGLVIEKEFEVGNCKFVALTKEFISNLYDKQFPNANPIHKQQYIDGNNKFINTVLIRSSVFATEYKSLEIAREQAELSVSAVKCMLGNESMKFGNVLFDVDFKYINYDTVFLSSSNDKILHTSHFNRFSSPEPTRIDKLKYDYISYYGLDKLSNFIKCKKDSDLYHLIKLAINYLGDANSTFDLHLGVVRLITTIESIIVHKKATKACAELNLKKVIKKLPIYESYVAKIGDEAFGKKIGIFWNVRSRFLHNGEKISVNAYDLQTFKTIAIQLILYIIDLSNDNRTVNDMYLHFEIIKK